MPVSEMRFETPKGRKYLVQLCKHFAHKIEVDYTETEGRCALPTGPAVLAADEGGLSVRVEAADEAGMARARHIIDDHLRRFAFREEPGAFVWTETAAPG